MVIDGGEEPANTPERAAPMTVRVAQAKGRPMLSWVGTRPLRDVRAFPAQTVSRFEPAPPQGAISADVDWTEWPQRFDRGGLLFHAIQTTEKRVATIIGDQIEAAGNEQLQLTEADRPAKPAQLGFLTYRVNDDDLQIQHNEALELAVEHLGVARARADHFFAGTLGRELVSIAPFDDPVTVLDLQAVDRELTARPGEERDVVVVGLGSELSTQAWLDTWNRHRPLYRIRAIDLRTDPKHGWLFEHLPAGARVSFDRSADRVAVRIEDFVSPSILERLAGQEGVLAPQIDDWRAMVDSVAIDEAYDGAVFDIDVVDIPERKSNLAGGSYEVMIEPGSALPAAVRITDMLGEEVLVVEDRSAG